MKTIYLDNNATTQVAPEVLETILPYFHEFYGNPSSAHSFGGQVAEKVTEAREQVAGLLGARPGEIIFTSGGTESDNAAVRSALAAYPEKRHIVTSPVEHPAIRSLCQHLAKQGYRVTEVPVTGQGELDMDALRKKPHSGYGHRQSMWANNETGVIFPIEKAAEMAKDKGILFHTDAVQAVGKIPINTAQRRRGHALPLGPQAPLSQGDRGALCAHGIEIQALRHRRPSGTQSPGRNREHGSHHRAREGLRIGGSAHGRRKTQG